ncbi:MAG: hypothetical protein CMM57_10000 [Rhodospirillaceae bacterium]|nr:hypothetical protein [Rhodospirillaceae bacterium]
MEDLADLEVPGVLRLRAPKAPAVPLVFDSPIAAASIPTGTLRPDCILGSCDGTSCCPELTEVVRAYLAGRGYDVRVDFWSKGVEIVRLSGDPAVGRHGLQVEISRRIYMDEARLQKGADYAAAKDLFTGLIAELRQFAADCPPGRAA